MRVVAISVLLALSAIPAHAGSCVDPHTLLPSVVQLTSRIGEGAKGTAWFFGTADQLVTVEHVVQRGNLDGSWRHIELRQTGYFGVQRVDVMARVSRMVDTGLAERLAILQLDREIPNARIATVRETPLSPNELAVGIAYPSGEMHIGTGWFRRFSVLTDWIDWRAGYGLFDIAERFDRLALRRGGASGGPIFDCQGRVGSVFKGISLQRQYTHVAIPTHALAKLKR